MTGINEDPRWLALQRSLAVCIARETVQEDFQLCMIQIWKRLRPLALDPGEIERLVYASYNYAYARLNGRSHRLNGSAEREQFSRTEARQIARQAKRLAQSLDRLHRVEEVIISRKPSDYANLNQDHYHLYRLLHDAFYAIGSHGDAVVRFPNLRKHLHQFSAEVETCLERRNPSGKLPSQRENVQFLRRQALVVEMVPLVAGRRGTKGWALLCAIVNACLPDELRLSTSELRDDFRYLEAAEKCGEKSRKKI